MNEQATKIQIVINTLETMTIPATFDNTNKLLGVYQLLHQLRDELKEGETDAGEADAE
jgi:hypothetical protein